MSASKLVEVTLRVPEAIDPELRQLARATAHEAAVLCLYLYGRLTTAEVAEEVGLSPQQCEDWMVGRDVPLPSHAVSTARLQKRLPKLEVQTRELSYYNFLTEPRSRPTHPAPEDD